MHLTCARLAVAGCLAVALSGGAAEAGPRSVTRLLTCEATRADVAAIAVDEVHLGMAGLRVSASTRVHLTMRDGSVRDYALSGRANPLAEPLPDNDEVAGFAYPDFSCTVTYGAITAVQNCRGNRQNRACDVGVRIFGLPVGFAVSMTAERVSAVEAATVP